MAAIVVLLFIRELFRLLHVVKHVTEHTRSCRVLESGCNLRADYQRCTLVHPLNSGTNAALAPVQ